MKALSQVAETLLGLPVAIAIVTIGVALCLFDKVRFAEVSKSQFMDTRQDTVKCHIVRSHIAGNVGMFDFF
jgi:hypothetical protein